MTGTGDRARGGEARSTQGRLVELWRAARAELDAFATEYPRLAIDLASALETYRRESIAAVTPDGREVRMAAIDLQDQGLSVPQEFSMLRDTVQTISSQVLVRSKPRASEHATLIVWDAVLGNECARDLVEQLRAALPHGSPPSRTMPSWVQERAAWLIRWGPLMKFLRAHGVQGLDHRVRRMRRVLPSPVKTSPRKPSWYRFGELWMAARAASSNPERMDNLPFSDALEMRRP